MTEAEWENLFYKKHYEDIHGADIQALKFIHSEAEKSLNNIVKGIDVALIKNRWAVVGTSATALYIFPIIIKDFLQNLITGPLDWILLGMSLLALIISFVVFLKVAHRQSFRESGADPVHFFAHNGMYLKKEHMALLTSQIYDYQRRINQARPLMRKILARFRVVFYSTIIGILFFITYLLKNPNSHFFN